MSAPSNALPRLRTLCTNSKKPKYSGSCSCEIPRCGRSQLRKSDQKPAIVFTWTSHKPSPWSWRANSPPMIHILMAVSSALQTGIHAVLVCLHQCAWNDGVFDEGLDRLLLHIGQQMTHHLTTALYHTKDRWLFLRQRATARFAFASASTAFSTLALDYFGVPFMASYHIGFIALDLVGQRHCRLFFTIPPRSSVVI